MEINLSIMRKHSQWPLVKKILKTLQSNGYEAYLAGGCVRDFLLNKSPVDMDIATSAPPDKVQELFDKTLEVGKSFGTIIVIESDQQVEVTTFRKDGPYQDGRHPSYVEFSDIKEDASRRDFTINSMFLNPFTEELLDFFEGQKDLKNKIIKTVGSPDLRFEEDKLRLLRALRFSSQLDYQIEEKTFLAIKKYSSTIAVVSKERLLAELEKLSNGKAAIRAEVNLFATGLWAHMFHLQEPYIFPLERDFIEYGQKGWLGFVVFMAYWHENTNQGDWWSQFKSWPLAKEFKRSVDEVLAGCTTLMKEESFMNQAIAFNSPKGPLCLELWRYDLWRKKEPQFKVTQFIDRFLKYCDKNGKLPEPLLHGKDLISVGFRQGPMIQEVLTKAYEIQILEKIKSKKKLLSRFQP